MNRRAVGRRAGILAAALGLLLLRVDGAGAVERTLAYTILMGGAPIGNQTVELADDGARRRAAVTIDITANILFMTYRFVHRRTEVWENGTVTEIRAETDDDGEGDAYSLKRLGEVYVGTLNGNGATVAGNRFPMSLWTDAILASPVLFDVVDTESIDVQIEHLGIRPLGGETGSQAGRFYRLRGDEDRDLWYGDDGILMKTRFKSNGFTIEHVRR